MERLHEELHQHIGGQEDDEAEVVWSIGLLVRASVIWYMVHGTFGVGASLTCQNLETAPRKPPSWDRSLGFREPKCDSDPGIPLMGIWFVSTEVNTSRRNRDLELYIRSIPGFPRFTFAPRPFPIPVQHSILHNPKHILYSLLISCMSDFEGS